jgi:hypothetical protein
MARLTHLQGHNHSYMHKHTRSMYSLTKLLLCVLMLLSAASCTKDNPVDASNNNSVLKRSVLLYFMDANGKNRIGSDSGQYDKSTVRMSRQIPYEPSVWRSPKWEQTQKGPAIDYEFVNTTTNSAEQFLKELRFEYQEEVQLGDTSMMIGFLKEDEQNISIQAQGIFHTIAAADTSRRLIFFVL